MEYLEMQFDAGTIEHLGVQMYSTLPPVIAELIANAYDAEAKYVKVELYDEGEKKIVISDNGHGMTFDDLNSKFLRIGRNRRADSTGQKSENGKRLVIGKKGIGKLSFFGIAHRIQVETIREGVKNSFILDWEELLDAGSKKDNYKPQILERNQVIEAGSGTKFILTKITRKTGFSPENIAYSLSKDFSVFDEEDFKVELFHNQSEDSIPVTNELRYKNIDIEYSWEFPQDFSDLTYEYAPQIKGKLIGASQVVSSKMNGIALFSRGKLVNEYSFLDINASSHDYSYITGWLNIDFIDTWSKEVISTNRRSLNWEFEETYDLKAYLESVYRKFFNQLKEEKAAKKIKEVENVTGISIDRWVEELPRHERSLARKMVKSIVNHGGIEVAKAGELISYVKDSFDYESFKELAHDIDSVEELNPGRLIEFFKDWKLIEAREFYKLAKVRIETIKKFDDYIKSNAKEVPTLHNFLKQFPWLLDPRIMNFKDEVTYSNLLRDHFVESEEIEEDKRIDFLCVDFSETVFIIELKRPKTPIGEKQLMQATKYVTFLKNRLGNEFTKNMYCFIIGERFVSKDEISLLADGLKTKGIFLKTYSELLSNANKYHQEFIDRYDQMTMGQSS